jgi:tetratricopeptide (TPR) repeat protein
MNISRFLFISAIGILLLGIAAAVVLYKGEAGKNSFLRTENLKTAEEAQNEIKKLKEDLKKERDQGLEDKQKLLDQATKAGEDKDKAVEEAENLKKTFQKSKEFSDTINEDLNVFRNEVSALRKDSKDSFAQLDKAYKKKILDYEARILTLEAQLDKAKGRLGAEAERYHYNLGVVYTQNKDFDSAVTEFKTALSYNPKNPLTHYNLGIIFDDYFKDKENARYHYNSFLELAPDSDDAGSVKEWLADLDKK